MVRRQGQKNFRPRMGTMDGFLKMGLDPGAILIPEIKGGCPFTLKSI